MSDSSDHIPTPETPTAADTAERTAIERTPQTRTRKTRTGGGQLANANATTHGLRSRQPLTRLALGTLPKSMRRVEIEARDFRAALEASVIDRHGEIDLPKAGLIATAAAWQRHSALCVRWLREHAETMTHAERLSYSREIATASANRDKAVAALKLERTAADVFDALYATPAIADVPPAAGAERSPNGAVGDVAADSTSPSPPQED